MKRDKIIKAIHNIEKRRGNIRELTTAEIALELESELTPEPEYEKCIICNGTCVNHYSDNDPCAICKGYGVVEKPNPLEKYIREHCNIEYDKKTGEEVINSSLSAVCIAFEEYHKQLQKPVPSDELRKELIAFLGFYQRLWEAEKNKTNTEIINDYLKTK